jgi:hypothetical protein
VRHVARVHAVTKLSSLHHFDLAVNDRTNRCNNSSVSFLLQYLRYRHDNYSRLNGNTSTVNDVPATCTV